MLNPVETVERIYEAFYTGDLDGARRGPCE